MRFLATTLITSALIDLLLADQSYGQTTEETRLATTGARAN
jgi:hypothetical protein